MEKAVIEKDVFIEEKNKNEFSQIFNEQYPTLKEKRITIEHRIRDQINHLTELLVNFCNNADELLDDERFAMMAKKLNYINEKIENLDYFIIVLGNHDLDEP